MRGFVPPPRGLVLQRSPEDKYERLQMVGKGSFGQVYLVRDRATGVRYVMKCVNVAGMCMEEKEDAMKEMQLLQTLDHPNIIRYVESFETQAGLRMVMEYASRGDLHQVIQARKGRRLSETQILDWFLQLCLGVKHLHEKHILHRDIKTSNILLSDKSLIKIGDFGISKVLAHTMQFARTCVGTPYYMSPEICQNRPYNNRSDVWAMGCVLYELCTLKHAFEANSINGLIQEILRGRYAPIHVSYTDELKDLIGCMLNRQAEKRPNVHALVQKPILKRRIQAFLAGDDGVADPSTAQPTPRTGFRENEMTPQLKNPRRAAPPQVAPVHMKRQARGRTPSAMSGCPASPSPPPRPSPKVDIGDAVCRAQRRVGEMRRQQRQIALNRRAQLDAKANLAREEAKLKQLQEAERNRAAAREQMARQRQWRQRKPVARDLPPITPKPQKEDATPRSEPTFVSAPPKAPPRQYVSRQPTVPQMPPPPSPFFLKNREQPDPTPLVTPTFARRSPTIPVDLPGAGVYHPSVQPSLQTPGFAPQRHTEVMPLPRGGGACEAQDVGEVGAMVATMKEIMDTAEGDDPDGGDIFVDAADKPQATMTTAAQTLLSSGKRKGLARDPLTKFELNNETYRVPDLRRDDSLSNRVEVLRCHLEDVLGAPKLMQVHRLLSDAKEEAAGDRAISTAKSILGEKQAPFLPLVMQLLFCEDVLNSNGP
eukprot:TRINITY_DN12715_c0_g1_i1.p1 TRINITY_DN12715_c0_g1~~TRINITY_DN12715_c0_g1_i1.p1  ORF type:complete len:709 (+),score=158.55 TRINITY_DN12715_c0_g1_i1:137-2263(+)